MITTLHGYVAGNRRSKLGIYEAMDKIALRNLDFIVSVSANLLAETRARGIPADSSCCIQNSIGTWNSVESQAYSGRPDIPGFVSQHDFAIGYIGRLSSEKCVDRLLEALEIVRCDYPGTALCIAGEGAQRKSLEKLVHRRHLSSNVLFCGYVEDVQRDVLPHIDCLALASETEGLPIVLLEAMWNRVPVIATAVGGIPELLDSGRVGLLCSESDSRKIAQAICRLIEDRPLRESLAEQAKQRVEELYSVAAMADAYEAVYKYAMQTKTPTGKSL